MHNNPLQIAVAGGGSWGTALAQILAENGHNIKLFLRDNALATSMNSTHENSRYLAGYVLNKNITATTNFQELSNYDIIVLAVPAQSLRAFLQPAYKYLKDKVVLVNTAKGLESHSGKTMQQVVQEELAAKNVQYAILSGPSFAAEVLTKQPSAVVLGGDIDETVNNLINIFSSNYFRCYACNDVIGIEVGGALKNIMAIASGVCDGLGFGYNSRAALITRGLAEMSRIGVAMGAQAITFMGLSGLGDLMLTCTGDLSRNRQVGLRLGRGESLEQILSSLGMVAEGVKTTEAVYNMTNKLQVSAPITHMVYDILYNNFDPEKGVRLLMTRRLKHELN